MERFSGTVSYCSTRGFCFVAAADGTSIFLHYKEIRDKLIPGVGDQITFLIRPPRKSGGSNEAFDAHITNRGDGCLTTEGGQS